MSLSADDFTEFFGALYRNERGEPLLPFPWQERLAREACEGEWPKCISVPTASGKTACIDIAIFSLAVQADWGERRLAPRRVFFIVDRRVIVDEAFDRSLEIARKLAVAKSGILKQVADRLRNISGGGKSPLDCYQLRGGVYQDHRWVRSPLQAMVICTTVDQIGSRLLYRGYGVSQGAAPVHAALTAHDSLLILDEAHCSNPFLQTVAAIQKYRHWGLEPVSTPFEFVVMSATPPSEVGADAILKLESADRDHPVLGRRLDAEKPTRLQVADKAKGKKALQELAQEMVKEAKALVSSSVKVIGIFVNRVATAKEIYKLLEQKPSDKQEAVLLTGRMRPFDKDAVIPHWREKIEARPGRPAIDHPVFVVSTQCLEVGANLDFDGLVTECAALDSLRQRFGRLNRLGRPQAAPGVIVIQKSQENSSDEDPVYGAKLTETWNWLNEQSEKGVIDMGIASLEKTISFSEAAASRLSAEQVDAPVMLPSHLDFWVQTSPLPAPDPDVSIFLHGPERNAVEVQVLWRADLDQYPIGQWAEIVSLCPPTVQECLPVQLHVLKRWWQGISTAGEEITDMEGDKLGKLESMDSNGKSLSALVWRGLEESKVTTEYDAIRPGDTIVLPVSAQGWNELGFVPPPKDTGALLDIGDIVDRYPAKLRLHPSMNPHWSDCESFLQLQYTANEVYSGGEIAELREALVVTAEDDRCPEEFKKLLAELAADKRLTLLPYPSTTEDEVPPGFVLSGSSTSPKRQATFSDEDNTSSRGIRVTLSEHNQAVSERAAQFAEKCLLTKMQIEDIALAGSLHDTGKADLRFQAWLHGGNRRIAEAYAESLAKSPKMPRSKHEYQLTRQKSNYPPKMRHELLSVRLAESNGILPKETLRRDTILHVIAAHHGHCRPFAPVIEDPNPEEVVLRFQDSQLRASSETQLEKLDSGVPERFWTLVRHYGWWGIAYLEAMVRLADWQVSEQSLSEGEEI